MSEKQKIMKHFQMIDLETNRNINTKQASDLEILDAFLKNCLAYSRRFLTAVLETFLEK